MENQDNLEVGEAYCDFCEETHASGCQTDKRPIPGEPHHTAFVGNLPNNIVLGDVNCIFQNLRIRNVHLTRDKDTDKFEGFCHVEFENKDKLDKALQSNGALVENESGRVG